MVACADNRKERSPAPLSAENRREKSLALLTQNFVKLFLCSNVSEPFGAPISFFYHSCFLHCALFLDARWI